jgi:hypothetical protein
MGPWQGTLTAPLAEFSIAASRPVLAVEPIAPESRKRTSKPPSETAPLRDDLLFLNQTRTRQFDPLQTLPISALRSVSDRL